MKRTFEHSFLRLKDWIARILMHETKDGAAWPMTDWDLKNEPDKGTHTLGPTSVSCIGTYYHDLKRKVSYLTKMEVI